MAKRSAALSHTTPEPEPEYAFLHIGKTAGSTVKEIGRAIGVMPRMFGHANRLQKIIADHPNIRLSFIVRDPLDRIISGFNSQLRQGRPRNNVIWRPAQAAAFAFFRTAEQYLRAILSDDAYEQSAAAYATANIKHIKRGYVHHFGSAKEVNRHRDLFYFIGRFERLSEDVAGIYAPLGISAETVRENLRHVHQNPVSTNGVRAAFNDDEIGRLKAYFRKEYRVYDALVGLPACAASSSIISRGDVAAGKADPDLERRTAKSGAT